MSNETTAFLVEVWISKWKFMNFLEYLEYEMEMWILVKWNDGFPLFASIMDFTVWWADPWNFHAHSRQCWDEAESRFSDSTMAVAVLGFWRKTHYCVFACNRVVISQSSRKRETIIHASTVSAVCGKVVFRRLTGNVSQFTLILNCRSCVCVVESSLRTYFFVQGW